MQLYVKCSKDAPLETGSDGLPSQDPFQQTFKTSSSFFPAVCVLDNLRGRECPTVHEDMRRVLYDIKDIYGYGAYRSYCAER